jgi:hypothetical protein
MTDRQATEEHNAEFNALSGVAITATGPSQPFAIER